jgi:hypothetical protein
MCILQLVLHIVGKACLGELFRRQKPTPSTFSPTMKQLLSFLICCSAFTAPLAQAQTLVSETFDAGVTFTGWNWTGGTIVNPPGVEGQARNNNSTFNQFFTTSFASTTLQVGDTITATFQYNPFSDNINSVRVGLFSGTAASANGWAQFDNTTAPSSTWTGYIGNLAIGSGNSIASLRGTSGVHPFFEAPTGSASEAEFFGTGTFRAASLTLARPTSSAIVVTLSEGANFDSLASVVSYSDTTSAITSFNIFSLYFTTGNALNGDMRYDNVTVSAIPEPSTWALLAVSLTALVVFRRRRFA